MNEKTTQQKQVTIKRGDQFARKIVNCSRNYIDLNKKDFPRELAKHTGTFEPLPIHGAPLKVRQFNKDVNRNTKGLICAFQLFVLLSCIAYSLPSH